MSRVRIVLADDHAVLRSGLKALLERVSEFEVVGEAADGRQAVEVAGRLRPDVAILDVGMPNMNGVEAARHISENGTAVVFLSMHSDESYVLRALKAGAKAYLLKESAEAELIAAIRAVHAGKAYFSPTVSRMLVEDYVLQLRDRQIDDSYDLLTSREREILQLVAEGKSSKEIANLINLSVYTVDTHRSNIMDKLNLHSVPELILYAVRKGVIS
jgi:two-component system, NarL family, response regulator NreC